MLLPFLRYNYLDDTVLSTGKVFGQLQESSKVSEFFGCRGEYKKPVVHKEGVFPPFLSFLRWIIVRLYVCIVSCIYVLLVWPRIVSQLF